METFASELVEIARRRINDEKQNFQLILITHSEQFANEIINKENIDYSLYEIEQKQMDNVQYSIVKKVNY
jgi:hypothetical protein